MTYKIIIGVVLVASSALISTPLMSRYWSDEQLTLASIALLSHGLLGVADFFRPIIVRRVSSDPSFATLPNLLWPSVISCSLIAALILAFGFIKLDPIFHRTVWSVSATIIIYGLYAPFWGLLDGALRMEETYLIRSASVAMLYLVLGFGSLSGQEWIIHFSLVVVNLIAGYLFWVRSRGFVSPGGWWIDSGYWMEAWNILIQNIARSVNDFGDRLVSMFYLPVNLAGGYIILSDFASRANFPSQLVSAYLYPVLCHHREKSRDFLLVGVVVSAAIVSFSILFYLWGTPIYLAYFGVARADMFWMFCCLLVCFGIYSLSYFGQAVLRSHGLDTSLSISYLVPATMCIGFLIFKSGRIDPQDIVILALLSKASAVFMMLRLLPIYRLPCVIGLVICAGGAGFVAGRVWM